MKHSIEFMRSQGQECVEKHRGDGLAPMVVELCAEVETLQKLCAEVETLQKLYAHAVELHAHALGYVSDDDRALATSLPGDGPAEADQADPDDPQAPEGGLVDDETTARRVDGENEVGTDQTPPDERRDLGKSDNEDA